MTQDMEHLMEKITQPTKEAVRDWLTNRRLNHDPLPDIGQIRLELGWRLAGPAGEADRVHS
jgi:hypothetical protein